MLPLFTAIEPFGPADGEVWTNYADWIGLPQLTELITLDDALCPSLLAKRIDADWDHIGPGPIDRGLFTSLHHVRSRIPEGRPHHLLCVFQNPPTLPQPPPEARDFRFVGCDLLDSMGGTSTLTNCGAGFPSVFSQRELSENGLMPSFERAQQVWRELPVKEPLDAHASCDLFAIFRAD